MKKLKVILPAILTLAVSTSAAVTGTVAWFTATRLQVLKMSGITAVNPESGLNLNDVKDVANTKVTYNAEGTPNKYTVTHGKQVVDPAAQTPVYNDVYLRDASINLSNEKVYAAVVNESGVVTGYDEQETAPYNDKDKKTFNEKGVVYASVFTMNFSPSQLDSGFNYSLFLDIKTSSVTATDDPAKNADLNKALRLGFKQGDNYFVWAPFASTSEAKTTAIVGTESKTNYQVKYVSGETLGETTNYNASGATKILIGDGAENAGDPAPVEDSATGIYAKQDGETNAGDKYIGYLGILNSLYDSTAKTGGTTVKVFTWFEGTDPNCVNDEFSGNLDNILSTLNFVMRRTAK